MGFFCFEAVILRFLKRVSQVFRVRKFRFTKKFNIFEKNNTKQNLTYNTKYQQINKFISFINDLVVIYKNEKT